MNKQDIINMVAEQAQLADRMAAGALQDVERLTRRVEELQGQIAELIKQKETAFAYICETGQAHKFSDFSREHCGETAQDLHAKAVAALEEAADVQEIGRVLHPAKVLS